MILFPEYIYDRMSWNFQQILTREWIGESSFLTQLNFYLIKNGYSYTEVEKLHQEYSPREIPEEIFSDYESYYFKERHIFDLLVDYLSFQVDQEKIKFNNKECHNITDSVVFKCILSKFKYSGKSKVYCTVRDIELMTNYSKQKINNSLKRLKENSFIKVIDKRDPEVKAVPRNMYKLGTFFNGGVFDLFSISYILDYSINKIDNNGIIHLYKLFYEKEVFEENGHIIRGYDDLLVKKSKKKIKQETKEKQYNMLLELIAFREIPYRFTLSSFCADVPERRVNQIWKERSKYWTLIERYQQDSNT